MPIGTINRHPIKGAPMPTPSENIKLVYIKQGKLFYKADSSAQEHIQSRFGQEIIDRAIRIGQKNEWKTDKSDISIK